MSLGAPHQITAGFLPLLDSALLVAAKEVGFAAQEGVDLTLARETSWANIRDRLIVGHFDAAHLLGPMAVASALGVGHLRAAMIAPFALGLGGNAITVSLPLWEQMAGEGASIGAGPYVQGKALARVVQSRARSGLEPMTFGMVYPFSCHNYELRYWLAAVGIDPDRDVRLVVIPPPFIADAMRTGQIDGFCVGEPWSSVAAEAGVGVIVTTATAIWPLSPEKVIGCRAAWAEENPDRLDALIRALYRAALWCEDPRNRADLAHMLGASRYIGTAANVLQNALGNRLSLAAGAPPVSIPDFYFMAKHHATFPWVSHALWFYSQMLRWHQVEEAVGDIGVVRNTYRPDIYRRALASLRLDLPGSDSKVERFFDETLFVP